MVWQIVELCTQINKLINCTTENYACYFNTDIAKTCFKNKICYFMNSFTMITGLWNVKQNILTICLWALPFKGKIIESFQIQNASNFFYDNLKKSFLSVKKVIKKTLTWRI